MALSLPPPSVSLVFVSVPSLQALERNCNLRPMDEDDDGGDDPRDLGAAESRARSLSSP